MNAQELKDRIEHLTRKREEFMAEIHALTGAIKDCEFWLERVGTSEAKKEEPTKAGA